MRLSDVRLHPTRTTRLDSTPLPRVRPTNPERTRTSDIELGHITFCTLENLDQSTLTNEHAAGLGRLVRKIVSSQSGLPEGFTSVEDLSRAYLDAVRSRPSAAQSRAATADTVANLRSTGRR